MDIGAHIWRVSKLYHQLYQFQPVLYERWRTQVEGGMRGVVGGWPANLVGNKRPNNNNNNNSNNKYIYVQTKMSKCFNHLFRSRPVNIFCVLDFTLAAGLLKHTINTLKLATLWQFVQCFYLNNLIWSLKKQYGADVRGTVNTWINEKINTLSTDLTHIAFSQLELNCSDSIQINKYNKVYFISYCLTFIYSTYIVF